MRSVLGSMYTKLSYGEIKKKSPEPILRYFGRHFGLQIFMKTLVSRYKPIFEGSFSKSYSFYYIKKITRSTKTALTFQILPGSIF